MKTWTEVLSPLGSEVKRLRRFVAEERKNNAVYPPKGLVFRAFRETPFDQVRVVILGQDPYHTKGVAVGLAFATPFGVDDRSIKFRQPPSLANIYKEMDSDVGGHHELGLHHTRQGVLLLNTALTVVEGTPGSHVKAWETFTEEVIRTIQTKKDVIWLLWGGKAHRYAPLIGNTSNHVLQAAHPSPLAQGAFFGCKHFSRTNKILKRLGQKEVLW